MSEDEEHSIGDLFDENKGQKEDTKGDKSRTQQEGLEDHVQAVGIGGSTEF